MNMKYLTLILLVLSGLSGVAYADVATDIGPAMGQMERAKALLAERKEQRKETPASDSAVQPQDALSGAVVLKMVKGLGFCIGLLLIIFHVLKRGERKLVGDNHTRIKVLERTPLSSRTTLLLVEVDGERSLLALGGEKEQITSLSSFESHSNSIPSVDEKPFAQELQVVCEDEPKKIHA